MSIDYIRCDLLTEVEVKAWNEAIDAAEDIFKWNECDLHPHTRKIVRKLIKGLRR